MNEHFTRQAEQFFNAAKEARVPENVQAMVADGVSKTREVYEKAASVARDQAKVAEDMVLNGQASAKNLGSKLIENAVANTEAAFEAAQAMARARSLPEAAKIQADFMQRQMALAGQQTREFFEISTRMAQETMQSLNSAAQRSMDAVKKSG